MISSVNITVGNIKESVQNNVKIFAYHNCSATIMNDNYIITIHATYPEKTHKKVHKVVRKIQKDFPTATIDDIEYIV